jgi:hypothetical protein
MEENFGLTDDQIDQLVGDMTVNPPSENEAPMEGAQSTPTETNTNAPFLRFKANGKEIEATEDQVRQWASQGYDYGRLTNEFKTKQDEFISKQNQFNEKYQLYQKIDEYAQSNPDWWSRVQQGYQEAQQGQQESPTPTGDLPPEVQNVLQGLQKEISELREFKNGLTQKEEQARIEQEDQKLASEVDSIRQLYPDLDWTNVDSNGKHLELKVLEHAQKIGTNSFKAAFRDLMFDDLLNHSVSKAKDETIKTVQRNQKLGLLGETPDPLKKYLPTEPTRNQTWDDVLKEAMEEVGVAD